MGMDASQKGEMPNGKGGGDFVNAYVPGKFIQQKKREDRKK